MPVSPVFRAPLAAYELLHMLDGTKKKSILDVGGGAGVHARFFSQKGFDVEILDRDPDWEGVCHKQDLFSFEPEVSYDVIWTSHCLEHFRNPGMFLDKVISLVKDDGVIGIIVPPLSSDIRVHHLTLWNAGQLLINLAHAGLDCSDAHVGTSDYNVCVLLNKKVSKAKVFSRKSLPKVNWGEQFFDGDIEFLNWYHRKKEFFTGIEIKEEFKNHEKSLEYFNRQSVKSSQFFWKKNSKGKRKHFYYCSETNNILISN